MSCHLDIRAPGFPYVSAAIHTGTPSARANHMTATSHDARGGTLPAASLRRSGDWQKAMGETEESQDSADRKEVGFKEGTHREQTHLPAYAAFAVFLLQKPGSQLCKLQPSLRPDSYLEPKVLGLQPLEVKWGADVVQRAGCQLEGAWTSSPCLWWGCSGRQGSDGKGGEQTK